MESRNFEHAVPEFLEGPLLERVVPLSESQIEVWLADRLGTDASLAFNESITVHIRGVLSVEPLWRALDVLVARHESLRSTVSPDGTELLVAAPAPVLRTDSDLSGLDDQERQRRLKAACVDAVTMPFDLADGPLFRATLLRMGDQEWALVLTAHHVVCDGWSWGVILRDLGALYAAEVGHTGSLPEAARYTDYVAWSAQDAASAAMADHERYWLGVFDGPPPDSLDLPTDRPRPAARTFRSHRLDRVIPANTVGLVRGAGAKAGASLFSTLFCAFALTLRRLTRQDDLVIGVPAAGQSASDMPELVGHCVNLLPVRVSIDDAETVQALLKRVSGIVLDAFDHQTLGYGSLLKKLSLPRDPSRLPLVSVMFNVDPAVRGGADAFPDVAVTVTGNPRLFENFELFVNVVQADEGLRVECQFNTDLFDERSVARWLDGFETLIGAIARDAAAPVGQLAFLSAEGRAEAAALQPAPTPFRRQDLMHSAFERQAQATPERRAVTFESRGLTYAELDRASTALAHLLRARGLERGGRVGICLERGPEMVIALLAVLKAGGTYIPLDPGFPPARLAYYAEDAVLALLVTESRLGQAPRTWRPDADSRIVHLDAETAWRTTATPGPVAIDTEGDDAAYVIYTSGSTGQPKGVAVPHRAVVNFLESMARQPGLDPDARLAAVTTLSFDIAVLELLLPLTVGAEVVLVPRDTAIDGAALKALLQASGATVMQATPGMWRNLIDAEWKGGPAFTSLVGGESLPADLADSLLDRSGAVWNLYGPTETTIWSTVWRVDRRSLATGGVSIGLPIDNTSVWVLDPGMEPCPVGVPGEIWIGGDGVAVGYVNRPELTAERFVSNPFGEGRLYRTGDRGRWRNDGLLEHLGRLDFQVKVRGYRIELGEIEAALATHPQIDRTVVVTREDVPGDVRIVAYLVPRGSMPDAAALRDHLAERLPEYMIPQHFVELAAIPLLPNGKVARKALPAPVITSTAADTARVPARNEVERQVLEAMESALNLPGLGVTDDFFVLGGHSLLAARLTARLNRDFGIALPMRALFEARTPERLARAVDDARKTSSGARPSIQHVEGRQWAPLTPMQERVRFVEELHPGRVVYNTPSAHRLKGPLDARLFEEALRVVARRQPALRTSIGRAPDGSGYVQKIAASVDVHLPFEDLSQVPASEREGELLRRMQQIIDTPMDIYSAPLFRAALYRLEPDHHAFLFMPHHLIWDGWSFDLLYDELSAAYGALVNGTTNPLPPLPITYDDFAEWHAGWMKGPEFQRQFDYWKRRVLSQDEPLPIRPDHARKAGSMSGEGASEWVRLGKATTERLREIAVDFDVTLNMLTMAIYTAMMAEVAGSASIVVGVPVRGRQQAELEPIMGFFNNLLPLQIGVDARTPMADFIRAIKQDLLDAMTNQDVPFESLAEDPAIAARVRRTGLYQVLFSFQDARARIRQWGPLAQSSILVFQKGATEDLGLWLMEVPNGLEGGLVYNADLYTAQTACAFRDRFIELAERLAREPHLTVSALTAYDPASAAAKLLRERAELLPEPERPAPSAAARAAAPSDVSEPEGILRSIWADLLDITEGEVQLGDNFFDLGGSSLLAMRAVERAQKALGFTVDARRYAFESLAQLAKPAAGAGART